MRSKVYCLMWSGRITDAVKDILFMAGCYMVVKGMEKLKLKNQVLEGAIITNRVSVILGSVAGSIFRAEIETNSGTSTIKYLIRTADADEMAVAAMHGYWEDGFNEIDPSSNAVNN